MSAKAVGWALEQKVGNKNGKLVLIALADNADSDEFKCWPSAKSLAERAEISIRAVYYALDFLSAHGFIEKQEQYWPNGGSRSPLYTILVGGGSASRAEGGVQALHRGMQEPVQGGVHLFAEQEPSIEPSIRKDSRSLPNGKDHKFDQFWDTYPRKVGKKKAHQLFDRALKETTFEQIMFALGQQKREWRDQKYIPHPATWLGQGRWDDGGPSKGPDTPITVFAR